MITKVMEMMSIFKGEKGMKKEKISLDFDTYLSAERRHDFIFISDVLTLCFL